MTLIRSRFARAAAAAALVFLGGCSVLADLQPKMCTTIGCVTGLTVHINQKPAGAFRVEVFASATDAQPLATYDCTDANCGPDTQFSTLYPANAYIKVTMSVGVRATQFSNIAYITTPNPNGPRCGEPCRHATVTVDAPV